MPTKPIERFWRNLKFAKREIESAERVLVSQGSPQREFSLDLWLIPQTVEGFDSSDFSFLPDHERQQLEDAVERFRGIVREVNSGARPASQNELEEAKSEFLEISGLIELDRYADADEYRIARILERCRAELERKFREKGRAFPVVELQHRLDIDPEGEEVLWIGVVVPDANEASEGFFEDSEEFRRGLHQLLRSYGVEYWPHVQFWTESEQNEKVDIQG